MTAMDSVACHSGVHNIKTDIMCTGKTVVWEGLKCQNLGAGFIQPCCARLALDLKMQQRVLPEELLRVGEAHALCLQMYASV